MRIMSYECLLDNLRAGVDAYLNSWARFLSFFSNDAELKKAKMLNFSLQNFQRDSLDNKTVVELENILLDVFGNKPSPDLQRYIANELIQGDIHNRHRQPLKSDVFPAELIGKSVGRHIVWGDNPVDDYSKVREIKCLLDMMLQKHDNRSAVMAN